MSKLKKFLIILIVLSLVTTGTVFGLSKLKKKNTEKKKVDVYSVSQISADGSWFFSGDYNSGYVDSSKEQRVYVGKSQKVAEIRVSEGDVVKAGDVLAVYDVTAKALQLDIQRTSLEVTRARIESARYDLNVLQNTTPVEEKPETEPKPVPKPDESKTEATTEATTETTTETTEAPNPTPDSNAGDNSGADNNSNSGNGEATNPPSQGGNPSNDKPSESESTPPEGQAPEEQQEQGPALEDKVLPRGEVNNSTNLIASEATEIVMNEGNVLYEKRKTVDCEEGEDGENCDEDLENLDEAENLEDEEDPDKIKEPKYTEKELAEAIKNKQAEINRMEINYQLELIAFQILEYQSNTGEVYCNFDGVVKTVLTEDEAAAQNKPLIVVGSGDGYALKSSIGELSLTKVKPGDPVTLECYEDGMTYTGKVTEISNLPEASEYGSYSYDGSSQSYYPITIAITDADNLRQGMYMDIKYDTLTEEKNSSLYLLMPFVKKEGGKYYVMKSVDGQLKKQYISTGKIVYNEYCEVLSGVSPNDELAFPYSSEAEEGIQTEHKEFDESFIY